MGCFRKEFGEFIVNVARIKGVNILSIDTISAVKFKLKYKNHQNKVFTLTYYTVTDFVAIKRGRDLVTYESLQECYDKHNWGADDSKLDVLSFDTHKVLNFLEITDGLVAFKYVHLGFFKKSPYFGIPLYGVFRSVSVDRVNPLFLMFDNMRVSIEELKLRTLNIK